ncbi:uncharacterized protein LOC119597902 [Penaeus monodon]|uniref:uncharacterized protein LOC119597902 n=1 Tax=Penaeus monodon TaxID=6687 RepID=UPI0018A6E73E|nr:uncharacterized protein LOC119597902 [Penaeus monodon]
MNFRSCCLRASSRGPERGSGAASRDAEIQLLRGEFFLLSGNIPAHFFFAFEIRACWNIDNGLDFPSGDEDPLLPGRRRKRGKKNAADLSRDGGRKSCRQSMAVERPKMAMNKFSIFTVLDVERIIMTSRLQRDSEQKNNLKKSEVFLFADFQKSCQAQL